jgi:hypothetical protein
MSNDFMTRHLRLIDPNDVNIPSPNPGENPAGSSSKPSGAAGDCDVSTTDVATSHVAAVWRPMPLRVWAEVRSGDDWRENLAAAVLTAYEQESDVIDDEWMDFARHDGDGTNCSDCAELQAQSSPIVGTVRDDRSAVGVLAAQHTATGATDSAAPASDPDAYRDAYAGARQWTGPAGEISWHTQDLTLTTVVAGDDWLTRLAEAYVAFARAQLPLITLDDLEFGE